VEDRLKILRLHGGALDLRDFVAYRAYSPVNPLLLISAISISLTRKVDYKSFLLRYAEGLEVHGLEHAFIRLPLILTEKDNIERIVESEDNYVEALGDWAKEFVDQKGRLLKRSGEITVWDNCWAVWHLVNPIFMFDPFPVQDAEENLRRYFRTKWLRRMPRKFRRLLIRLRLVQESDIEGPPPSPWCNGWVRSIMWGHKFNDTILRAFDHYVGASKSLQSPETDPPKDDQNRPISTNEAPLDPTILSVLAKRAFRLYQSTPHEIAAHSTSLLVLHEMRQGLRTTLDAFVREYPLVRVKTIKHRMLDAEEFCPAEADPSRQQVYVATNRNKDSKRDGVALIQLGHELRHISLHFLLRSIPESSRPVPPEGLNDCWITEGIENG